MSSGTGTTGDGAKRSVDETKETARQEAHAAGETIRQEAQAVAEQAGELGREHAERRFEQGKRTIEGQVDAVGGALGDAADRLRAENNPLASYADELSGQLSQLSHGIENSTLDDVAVKTRQLARDNPGLFVMGSVVAGLAAARFFKASAERERRERHESVMRDSGYEPDYGRDGRSGYGRDGRDYGGARSGYRSPLAGGDAHARGSAGAPDASVTRVPMDSTASSRGATVPPATASGSGATGTGNPRTAGTATTTTGA